MSCKYAYVRAVEGDRIEGYLALWGDPRQVDCFGTWFDRDDPPDFGLIDGAPIRLMYEHGQDPIVGKTIIGKVVRTWHDNIGVAFEAILFSDNAHYRKIKSEIARGVLGVSSASAEHLAEFDEDGKFRTWLLTEVSLTKKPCEPRMKVLHVTLARDQGLTVYRAKFELGQTRESMVTAMTQERTDNSTLPMRSLEDLGVDPNIDAVALISELVQRDGIDAISAIVEALKQVGAEEMPETGAQVAEQLEERAQEHDAQDDDDEDETQTARPQPMQRVGAQRAPSARDVAREMLSLLMKKPSASARPTPSAPIISNVRDSLLDSFTPGQLTFVYQAVEELRKQGRMTRNPFRADFLPRLAAKTRAEVARGAYPRLMPPYRANEVVHTGQAGFGAEWMQVLPGTELWERVRSDARLFNALIDRGLNYGEIPQGYNQETILVEGADPTFYVAGEVTDVASNAVYPTPTFATSKFGTAKRTLSVRKLGAATVLSREMQEDTVFDVLTQTYNQLQRTAVEQLEFILINGDEATAANTNINLIDGTPASAPTRPSYLLFNGILKLPLVTTTALSYDAQNTFTDGVFLELLKRLPAADQIPYNRLLYVMDMDTAIATMNLASVKTRDVFEMATLENGMLPFLYGIGVLPSAFMYRGRAQDGRRSGTEANNNRGRIALVRADRWAFRYKRPIEIDVDRNVYTDSTTVVCFLRCGFTNFSDTTGATAAFNVNVTI